MKVIKCGFSKTFPLNQYYEKIWMEAELNEGDNERDCLYDLKRKVESFFFESKAAAEKQMGTQVVDVGKGKWDITEQEYAASAQHKPKNQEETIIEVIGKCEDISALKSYELIAKNNAAIKIMYDLRLKQLS